MTNKLLYANFEAKQPHTRYMTGHYIKNKSCAFVRVNSAFYHVTAYIALGDYDIEWQDDSGDRHIDHMQIGCEYLLPQNIFTEKPKFTSV